MKTLTLKAKQSTREKILHIIKSTPNVTVDLLASEAGISPVTVRHHLNALQADSLIEATTVRRQVGRPHYVYNLSEAGEELFPQKYMRLSGRLIQEMKNRLPVEALEGIFDGVVESIIAEHRGQFEHLPFEKRLDYLVALLSEEGFLAEWEKLPQGGYRIKEYNCPYLSIGDEHSEVCAVDTGLILNVLNGDMQQHSCMLEGDACCEFTVAPPVEN